MYLQFLEFIKTNKLFAEDDKILLAVSGGIDSVVMLDLFAKTDFNIAIAHCNFQLRNEESDGDAKFVKDLSEEYHIQFFEKKFDTNEYAKAQGISIQMAARNLRYEWFEKIRKTINFDYIAIAHNENDIVETFFINLLRGTGIRGLTGIKAKNDKIVRPLLFANRKTIENYCRENNLTFREDSSNQSVKYKRNKIRHKIIPLFEELNSAFSATMIDNIKRLSDTEKVYSQSIKEIKNQLISYSKEEINISIDELQKIHLPKIFLFEILNEYNFTKDSVENIYNSLDFESGKQFFSQTHRLIKDRDFLIITKNEKKSNQEFFISAETTEISKPISLKFSIVPSISIQKIPTKQEIACIDFDKIRFPLIIRKWKKGDRFFPLGMNKQKKLSDFFIDLKLSLFEKENQWLLISEDKIVWVIGKRIDNRFKISEKTKKILFIES